MAYNGSGTFSRLYSWVTDRNNSVKIRADRMDEEMDGFATGLSNAICRDGQSTITADIPFNSRKITGLGDAAAATDALNRQTADARYQRNAEDLTNITDLADGDEFTVGDASDSGNNKAVLWSVIKSELLAEMTTGFFPSGTAMLFVQTNAPTGWTKSLTHNNKALRVVTGTASSGGTIAFDVAFASRALSGSVGSTTLTIPDIPAHNHSVTLTITADNNESGGGQIGVGGGGSDSNFNFTETTSNTGGSTGHAHGLTMNNLNIDVQYVDVIIATRD